jgi:DNA helicase-2/ATP-dependent DNA helicase PcrA
MRTFFADYEREKRSARKLDFEDLLEQAILLFETSDSAVRRFQNACRAITVDEFQDVNLLQQTLLDRWLGDRDDVCVVGDDYQAIFGFTGASPDYLLGMRERFQHATRVTLETNYRSTPQILSLANRLAPRLGGVEKTLVTNHVDGHEPIVERYGSSEEEIVAIVEKIAQQISGGSAPADFAVLYRLNARSVPFELALSERDIPYQVAKGGFLERPAARTMIFRLGKGEVTDVVGRVVALADEAGLIEHPSEDDLGRDEFTRQLDLKILIDLATDFDDGSRTTGNFVNWLRDHFNAYEAAKTRDAVRLSTYHSAKGLEWPTVFLPHLSDGELPFTRAIDAGTVNEERRLFYVGVTRAKSLLHLSWSVTSFPSRFIDEVGLDHRPTDQSQKPRTISVARIDELRRSVASLPSAWKGSHKGPCGRDAERWTDKEDAVLKEAHEGGLPLKEIAELLERRPTSIHTRLQWLAR